MQLVCATILHAEHFIRGPCLCSDINQAATAAEKKLQIMINGRTVKKKWKKDIRTLHHDVPSIHFRRHSKSHPKSMLAAINDRRLEQCHSNQVLD